MTLIYDHEYVIIIFVHFLRWVTRIKDALEKRPAFTFISA